MNNPGFASNIFKRLKTVVPDSFLPGLASGEDQWETGTSNFLDKISKFIYI